MTIKTNKMTYEKFLQKQNHMTKQGIRLIIIAVLFTLAACVPAIAQTKPKQAQIKPVDTLKKPVDTLYSIKGDKELNNLYALFQAGIQAINTSDNFSVNQRKYYLQLLKHLDSLYSPQIIFYHPKKTRQK